ncbi:MAG: cupin domain-containing protein [Pseudomonadales bacterium]|nr:cupin domain-containing protein [Pseudomonadales bacterium]
MALPQEISPVNSDLMDGLAAASKMEWIVTEPGAAMKILWTGAETGRWAVLLKWDKGYVAGQHKHLSAAFVYMLKGKLQVRDGIINAGDFVHEPNGMLHGTTTALEDSEYLFFCDGPVLFYNDDGFTGYLGWEELERMKNKS